MKSMPASFEEKTFDPGPSFGSGGQYLHEAYSFGKHDVKGLFIIPENEQEKEIIRAVQQTGVFVGKGGQYDLGLWVEGTGRSLHIPIKEYCTPEEKVPCSKYLIEYVDRYADGMSMSKVLAAKVFEFLSSQKHDSRDWSITAKNMRQFLLDPQVAGLLYPEASKKWEIGTDGLLTIRKLEEIEKKYKEESPKPKEPQIGGPSPEEWLAIEQEIADGPPAFSHTDVRNPRVLNLQVEALPPTLEPVTCHRDKDPATGKEKVVYFAVCFNPPTESFTLECFYDCEKAKGIDQEGRKRAEPYKAILSANIYTQTILKKLKAGETKPSEVRENYNAKVREGAKTGLCNVWVICPDGTLMKPNKTVNHPKHGSKTWDVVGPEEMILNATGATLAIQKRPSGGAMTEAQVKTAKQLAQNWWKSCGFTGDPPTIIGLDLAEDTQSQDPPIEPGL